MTAPWMVYCLVTSLLLGGAAVSAERVLRLYSRPVRWAWAGALLGSIGMPALAWLLSAWGSHPHTLVGSALLPPIVEQVAGVTSPGFGSVTGSAWISRWDGLLLGAWVLSSAGVAGALLLSWWTLGRLRQGWPRAFIGGLPVLISPEQGPAVLGVFRGQVVLPAWLDELGAEFRHAVLLHETEHLRSGDHRLRAAGLAVLVSLAWNPVVWWLVRRLRLAMECDCDARVLARRVPVGAYGELLVTVGSRRRGRMPGLAAFAEPRGFLERRIRVMTQGATRNRSAKAAVAGALAALAVALSCETPVPTESEGPAASVVQATGQAEPTRAGGAEVGERPQPTPYDTPPQLVDADRVRALLATAYPPDLRAAGVGGTVVLWLHLASDGTVLGTVIKEGSGEQRLDEAAVRVAEKIRFTPARFQGEPVPVWVMLPLTFQVSSVGSMGPGARGGETPGLRAGRASAPSSGSRIRIQGSDANPLSSNPLVYVDGRLVPTLTLGDGKRLAWGDGSELHPEEIRTIEIVKGDEAVARFGAAGRRGAILITTKMGG